MAIKPDKKEELEMNKISQVSTTTKDNLYAQKQLLKSIGLVAIDMSKQEVKPDNSEGKLSTQLAPDPNLVRKNESIMPNLAIPTLPKQPYSVHYTPHDFRAASVTSLSSPSKTGYPQILPYNQLPAPPKYPERTVSASHTGDSNRKRHYSELQALNLTTKYPKEGILDSVIDLSKKSVEKISHSHPINEDNNQQPLNFSLKQPTKESVNISKPLGLESLHRSDISTTTRPPASTVEPQLKPFSSPSKTQQDPVQLHNRWRDRIPSVSIAASESMYGKPAPAHSKVELNANRLQRLVSPTAAQVINSHSPNPAFVNISDSGKAFTDISQRNKSAFIDYEAGLCESAIGKKEENSLLPLSKTVNKETVNFQQNSHWQSAAKSLSVNNSKPELLIRHPSQELLPFPKPLHPTFSDGRNYYSSMYYNNKHHQLAGNLPIVYRADPFIDQPCESILQASESTNGSKTSIASSKAIHAIDPPPYNATLKTLGYHNAMYSSSRDVMAGKGFSQQNNSVVPQKMAESHYLPAGAFSAPHHAVVINKIPVMSYASDFKQLHHLEKQRDMKACDTAPLYQINEQIVQEKLTSRLSVDSDNSAHSIPCHITRLQQLQHLVPSSPTGK